MERSELRSGGVRGRFWSGLAFAAVASTCAIVHGQSAQMIRVEDDGSGAMPQIMHFSMPDFGDLRMPDFTQRDLPTFRDRLVLSEAQTKVMETLIAKYLEDFKALAMEKMPMPANGPMRIKLGPDGPGPDGEEGGEREAVIFSAGEALPDLDAMIEGDPEIAEFGEGMPGGMAIGVEVRVPGPGPEGEGAAGEAGEDAPAAGQAQVQGEPGVAISFESANGEEIPEEVRKQLEEAAAKMAEKMKAQIEQQMAEGGDPQAALPVGPRSMEEIQQENAQLVAKAEEFRQAKAQLRQEFVTTAQSNLIPEQIERWPSLERTLLRNRSLPKGRLAGERTDLVKVLAAVEISESDREALAANVETYEVTLDSALKKRDEVVTTASREIDLAIQNQDPDKAIAIADRATALRLAVRSINEQYAQSFAAMLPASAAEAFNRKVLEVSYPMVYRQTRGQKTFAMAKEIEGVPADRAASIADLEKAYLAELSTVNTQIRQAIDKFEPDEPKRGLEQTKRVLTGGEAPGAVFASSGQENPVREAYARRRALDDRYCKLVADMLTPEQAAQLPKAPVKTAGQPIIIRTPIESQ